MRRLHGRFIQGIGSGLTRHWYCRDGVESGRGEAGGALGSCVLGKLEPAVATSTMAASSQWAGADLVLTIMMRAAHCRWAAAYMVGTNSSYQKSIFRGGVAVAL